MDEISPRLQSRYRGVLKKAGPLIKRTILMLGYGALCLMIGYLLAGSGHGAFEPTAFQLSWALVVYAMRPIPEEVDLWRLLLVFLLYLIGILLLNTLFAQFKKPWLRVAPFVVYSSGSFVAISMLRPAARLDDWWPFFITGLVVVWVYLSLDWRLATGQKKKPNE